MTKKIIIKISEAGERLDLFLAKKFPEYSRSYFSKLISKNSILVNSNAPKASYLIKENDKIIIDFVEIESKREVVGEKIDLDVIYEDENVIVISKQPGLVVHPASGNWSGTLVNALVSHFPAIKKAVYDTNSKVSKMRPGLVHRLDKDTSGVMIVAKNSRAMHSLSRQIQNRTIKKTYLGLCFGWPKNSTGTLTNYLGRHPKNRKLIADIGEEKGKEAILDYEVLKFLKDQDGNKISFVKFDLKTGRTHQIRVQISCIGHPILGDKFYCSKLCEQLSKKYGVERQLLHSYSLKIILPGDINPREFIAPIPQDFETVLRKFKDVEAQA